MASDIEWTDETWNPVVGCTRVSAGCDHCYAMGVAHRGMSPQHRGLTKLRPKDAARPGIDWNGTVRTVPHLLAKPLHWRKPRRVFVNSMSDLFHDAVPFEFIAAVFGVMAACPQHTFQVLTKRPARMREFFRWYEGDSGAGCSPAAAIYAARSMHNRTADEHPALAQAEADAYDDEIAWPLPNVHLGVSVEDQATADERIPILLDCPAAVHWISAEPLLGPVRIDWAIWQGHLKGKPGLLWAVIGGESGPGARPLDIEWVRDLLGYMEGSDCRPFVKQLGARPGTRIEPTGAPDDGGIWNPLALVDRSGGDPSEWPDDLRVREMPDPR